MLPGHEAGRAVYGSGSRVPLLFIRSCAKADKSEQNVEIMSTRE